MNKKLITLASVFLIIVFGVFFFGTNNKTTNSQQSSPSPTQSVSKNVKVSIDFGNGEVTDYAENYSEGVTAFDILKSATDNKKLKLQYKQYSFGVLVESINGVANSKDKAWIYFVNGKSANVGADKFQLKPGDMVEWKYITPSGE